MSGECGSIRLCIATEDDGKTSPLRKTPRLIRKQQSSPMLFEKSGKRTYQVLLVGCNDLLPKDSNGLSDPFVVFVLGSTKQKSKTIYKDLNPVYNQTFTFQVQPSLSLEDFRSNVLHVSVFDRDRFQKEFIGHVQIPLDDVPVLRGELKTFEQTYILRPQSYYEVKQEHTKEFAKKRSKELLQASPLSFSSLQYVSHEAVPIHLIAKAQSSSLDSSSSSLGEHDGARPDAPLRRNFPSTPTFQFAGSIFLAIDYRKTEKELSVLAVCADDVDPKDKSGLSDPFVELHLGEGTRPRKGPVEKKTLHPYWNHQFNLLVPPGATSLTVSVYDWNHSGRELIGTTLIPIQSLPLSSERWYILNSQDCLGFATPLNTLTTSIDNEEERSKDEHNRPIRRQILRDRQYALAQKEYHAFNKKYKQKAAKRSNHSIFIKVLWFAFAFLCFLALLSL